MVFDAGNGAILIFLAQGRDDIVMVHLETAGTDYDNERARKEAIKRTKEWFS